MKGLGSFFRLIKQSGHNYIRLVLLVTVPAIFWIGAFGMLGAWRLGQLEQAFVVMSFQQALLLVCAGLLLVWARSTPTVKKPCAVLVLLLMISICIASRTVPGWGSQRVGLFEFGAFLSVCSALLVWFVKPTKGAQAFVPSRSSLATAILGTFFSVAAAYVLIERDIDYVRGVAQVKADQLRDDVAYSVNMSMGSLQRLGARWAAIDHSMPVPFLEQEFSTLSRSFDEFKRLTYLDATQQTLHDKIVDPKYAHVLGSLQGTQALRELLAQAARTPHAYLKLLPGTVDNSPVGLIIAGIYKGSEAERFVVATVNLREMLSDRLGGSELECCFQISQQKNILHEKPVAQDDRVIAVGSSEFLVQPDLQMRLRYMHVNDLTRFEQPFLPEGVLLFGMIFTFLANSSQRLTQVVRRRNSLLQYRALHDALTGLPNRRMLVEKMRCDLELCKTGHTSLSVVFLALDDLRLISDTLGHEVSDELLKQCARRMRSVLPEYATLARLDAGDFVICVTGQTQAETETLTRELLAALQEPFEIEPHLLRVSAFAGVTRCTNADMEPLQLVRQADMAMLEARRKRHRPWLHYRPELGEKVQARLALYNDLQQAIESESIELHYQPIIDGHSGEVAIFEVLMRQWHRERGLIAPAVFIPMAEESGQIMPLTDWLLRRVCLDAKRLDAAGFGHIPLAVNISARYFQRPNFVEKIREILEQGELAPSRLHLEITESVLLDDTSAAIAKLRQLRELGVQAGLDDFGTGYSSLAYLRDLPISVVKIDRVFIKNIISEPTDAAIVRAVCTLAHHMRLKVVIEGVETAAQLNFLRRMGCDLFQGFLFDRPKPLEIVIEKLRESGTQRRLPALEAPAVRSGLLLVGDAYWTASLSFGLQQAGVPVASVMSAADAFSHLAQNECQVLLVQDGLVAISAENLLSRVADIYPNVYRWLALKSDTQTGIFKGTPAARWAHRVWASHPQAQVLSQAVVALNPSTSMDSVPEIDTI